MSPYSQNCFVGDNPVDTSVRAPIRVAPKPAARSSKKSRNVFYNDRGHPDESDDFDQLLHTIDGGTILCKKKFPTPPIDIDDPTFNHTFSEELHGDLLRSQLDLSHLLPEDADALLALANMRDPPTSVEMWYAYKDKYESLAANVEMLRAQVNAAPAHLRSDGGVPADE